MPESPNKLSQFWQELKRRKVTRTITVYAAAAFVTLELVSIIVEPLNLPEWTLPFIIVLLCVGFIIAILFDVSNVRNSGSIKLRDTLLISKLFSLTQNPAFFSEVFAA